MEKNGLLKFKKPDGSNFEVSANGQIRGTEEGRYGGAHRSPRRSDKPHVKHGDAVASLVSIYTAALTRILDRQLKQKLKEAKDDTMTDRQQGVISGKLEDLVPDVSFDVTNGMEIGEDEYKVFFQWETGERGEKHGKGTATFRCGFEEQTSRNILVAINFDLLDLTGLRGVNIDQDIFK